MVPLIAFGCQARVGKDTACNYLVQKYGGKVYHFSDNLYKILHFAQDTLGFPREKDVKFLQWVGTEWARTIKGSAWVDATINSLDLSKPCFIGDLRFPNEIQELQKLGFKCGRIVRADRPIDRNANHASETALADYDGWDAIIENNGSIEELYEKLDKLI